ncbi:hypothetical protein SAMN05443667_101742 [Flavobacterium gillisiae]|uniref:LTXXQ motif family protein n=1 Tax=Flavobacterium gillisiae TaxID=150146 RepID=A0A1H3Y213_9FLAO|nr:hypothetical protein [Flavobacterium gillisiae]SEA04838.1 hypothetical protein SAMN05443667_101742 [Flavobacterium gillisiae]
MKTIQILFVLALMLLSIDTASAQYGNNGYSNGGGGGGYGRNNRMNQMPQGPSQDKPKEIPVEVTVGKIMEKLKPELNLDVLQEIAISNVLIESIRSQGILLKAETAQEQKIKEIQALSETTDRKINDFLNEDQKVKYKALNEESNTKKKSRRNR